MEKGRAAAVLKQALDIENLITWALRDQGLGGSNAASKGGWQDLGTRIDSSGWSVPLPSAALWTDEDAMVVRQAIDALAALPGQGDAAALLIMNGRAGTRPDWCEEGEGQWVQERDGQGRPRWDWADPVNRTGEKKARMVIEGTRPELVRFHRAQYAVWHEAMKALVTPLNAVMAGHEAIGPFAPAEPWLLARPVIHYPVEGTRRAG